MKATAKGAPPDVRLNIEPPTRLAWFEDPALFSKSSNWGYPINCAGVILMRYVLDTAKITVQQQVLLVQNSRHTFGFPKGRARQRDPEDYDAVETVFQNAMRELHEETSNASLKSLKKRL